MMQYPPSQPGQTGAGQQYPNTGYSQWQQPIYPSSGTPYPSIPQPGQYQQPTQQAPLPPPKQKRQIPWLLLTISLVIGLLFGIFIGIPIGAASNHSSATQSATTATPAPNALTATANQQTNLEQTQLPTAPPVTVTPAPQSKWTTVKTFTGNGSKKTGIFTVPDDWMLLWKCDPSSFYGGSYNVQVFVYGSDGSLVDLAVNVICKAGVTHDSTEEHQAGDVYLDINSEAAWTIQIQFYQ